MSLRRGAGTLAIALTITGAGAGPAGAYLYTTKFEPITAASPAHHQTLEATVNRGRKHASGASHRQVASGVGRRDGLPTGNS